MGPDGAAGAADRATSPAADRTALRVVQAEPFNAEAPLSALGAAITPTALFFVRSNFAVPRIDPETWRLRVTGSVAQPGEFSLADIQALGATEITAVVECAGNGRRLMAKVAPGTPWDLGAVSTARFTGVPLARVLACCEIGAAAVEIVFRGSDTGRVEGGRVVHFERSLPLSRALDPTTLLVWAMNDAPLTPGHGFPLRLLVPGYYGVASVKWLDEIRAVEAPFEGHFQTERYIYIGHPDHAANEPVTRIRVRSIITAPAENSNVRGAVTIRGSAWSGHGGITRVQVSSDGGASWRDARLHQPAASTAPTLWEFEWSPQRPGKTELVARATDSSGDEQPLEPVWNELGYANNVAHRVHVHVQEC